MTLDETPYGHKRTLHGPLPADRFHGKGRARGEEPAGAWKDGRDPSPVKSDPDDDEPLQDSVSPLPPDPLGAPTADTLPPSA